MVVNWTIYLGFPRQSRSQFCFILYRLIVLRASCDNFDLNSSNLHKKIMIYPVGAFYLDI